MTNLLRAFVAAVLAGSLMTGGAFAASRTIADLLADGWAVVDTEVIDKDTVVRAMGNPEWVDDVMITMQKGSALAFCHVALLGTATDENLLTYNCLVLEPAGQTGTATPGPKKTPGQ